MRTFPTSEAQLVALTEQMIEGFEDNPDLFPSSNALTLQSAMQAFKESQQAQQVARAQAHMATELKKEHLKNLKEALRLELKQAEVDIEDDPLKWELIGRQKSRSRRSPRRPSQPSQLTVEKVLHEKQLIRLKWRCAERQGGRIKLFTIERREKIHTSDSDQVMSQWQQVDTSLYKTIELKGHPTGTLMEFRVLARNSVGHSLPSNTVEVIL